MDFGKEELSGFMLDHCIEQLRCSVPAPTEWDTDFQTPGRHFSISLADMRQALSTTIGGAFVGDGNFSLKPAGSTPQEGRPRSTGRDTRRRGAARAYGVSRSGAAATEPWQVACRSRLSLVSLTSKAVREIGRRYEKSGLDQALYENSAPARPSAGAEGEATYHRDVCSDPPQGVVAGPCGSWLKEAVKRRLVRKVGRETIRLLLLHDDLKPWRKKNVERGEVDRAVRRADGGRTADLRTPARSHRAGRLPGRETSYVARRSQTCHTGGDGPASAQGQRIRALRNGQCILRCRTAGRAPLHLRNAQPIKAWSSQS